MQGTPRGVKFGNIPYKSLPALKTILSLLAWFGNGSLLHKDSTKSHIVFDNFSLYERVAGGPFSFLLLLLLIFSYTNHSV